VFMDGIDEVRKLIDETQTKCIKPQELGLMSIEELSKELHEMIKYEQEIDERLADFKLQASDDVINYAKMVCKSATQKQILAIQEAYFEKIDKKYLNAKRR